MKLINLLVVLFIVVFCTANTFSDGFNDVYSKDGFQVIAVGNNGNVFMSYDAGATFGSYPQGSATLNSVYTINQKVWIVGNNGTVLVSINAGNTYSTYAYTANNLNRVSFIDENNGWLVGNGGTIAKTINGGVNWTAQTSPAGVNLTDVKFINSTNGYACGDGGTVIYTTNGGVNWLQYTTNSTKNLYSIDVSGSTIICAAADGVILKYNGSSWSTIDYGILTKTDVRGVSMLNSSAFYTCGGGGFINFSSDGGASRTYQANPMMGSLKSIFMYNSSKGWAVASNNNAILKTSNGATWSFQSGVTVGYSFTLKQVTSGNIGNPFCPHPKNKNGVFILAGSALYRSLDRGETWVLLNAAVPGSSCHSFFVNTLDTNLMIASKGSGGGRVIKSTDYGVTWTDVINPINLTSYGMPLEVDPNVPNTVYLAPDNAPIRKSTDWGTNWTILSGGEPGGLFRSPCDIIVQYGNSNVILVGDGTTGSGIGKVWKSTDGGLNWTLTNSVTGSEVPSLCNSSIDINLCYHSSWSSGSFWKSTNMGSTFTNLSRSGSLWIADIAKDDPNAVTYDEYGSNCWFSLDGGTTFTNAIPVGSSPAAGVFYMDKSTMLYQHGGGVHKFNITYSVSPVTGNHQISSETPAEFSLAQNFPNPFNPSTIINYNVSKASFITLKVYDIAGRDVKTLINANLAPGKYSMDFDASSLSTGIYFYIMLADGQKVDTRKMVLVK